MLMKPILVSTMWRMVRPCAEAFRLRIPYMAFRRRLTRLITSTFVRFVSLNVSITRISSRYSMVRSTFNRCLVLDELINLHRGQGMDLYWRDSLTCPTEEEYVEMVNNKTGGLLRLAVKLMQACSSSEMHILSQNTF